MNKASLRSLILAAEFAVIIAVLSQFTIPLGIVPLTGQTFAIGLTATVLGKRTGTYAILIYFLLGLIGLPVYAGMSSGFGVLFGPTGGYLIGFIFNGLLTGYILEKTTFNYTWAIIANIAGALVTLVFGMIWRVCSVYYSWYHQGCRSCLCWYFNSPTLYETFFSTSFLRGKLFSFPCL